MTHRASEIWVFVLRGRRIDLFLIREISIRLIFHGDFRDGAAIIWAKAQSGLLPGQDIGHVISSIILDI